ncbi:MAG TPA: DUF1326 domain-containing protein [Chloroflexota bacterium]|nr:DUF1326 domain-containing protein [Chloroflexota bacterium]
MAEGTRWSIEAEYFENCNCDVVCPCEVSPLGFLGATPDRGNCDVFLVFHINKGNYGDVSLDGLNAMIAVRTPGVMAEGNWAAAAYLDAKGTPEQQQALGAIFGGTAGGPMAALGPMITTHVGVKAVPIEYRNEGKKRSARIDGILDSTVQAVPAISEDLVVIKQNANPLFPGEDWVQASGVQSTYKDYDWDWDNSGRCADYASFRWEGP